MPDEIDVSTLADYAGELVFGGVGAPGLAGGQCLDVLGCFAKGATVAPDGNCSVALPGGSEENANVGLVMPLNGQGICGTEACIVALERDDLLGWKFENGRAVLPKAVCDRLGKDIDALAVTGACVTKTTSVADLRAVVEYRRRLHLRRGRTRRGWRRWRGGSLRQRRRWHLLRVGTDHRRRRGNPSRMCRAHDGWHDGLHGQWSGLRRRCIRAGVLCACIGWWTRWRRWRRGDVLQRQDRRLLLQR